jgi:GGDEF-like domain/PucR C-terminal helix-turn-helix domain
MSTMSTREEQADAAARDRLSNLQGLLVLSMRMTESGDGHHIVDLAARAVPSLGRGRLQGVFLAESGWQATEDALAAAEAQGDVESQFAVLSSAGGPIAVVGRPWSWAFPLRSVEGDFGFLVVAADDEPPAGDQFLLRVLAQQMGIALANARLHARERETADDLRHANAALADTLSTLERSSTIHDRLTQVAVAGEGQDGIALALYELTGFSVAIEDRHGNLRAWAGSDRPTPYAKDPPATRDWMLQRAFEAGKPVRHDGRLVWIARPGDDVLGVIALIDPTESAGEHAWSALEHAGTVLAGELVRQQSLVETDLRLLVDELLAGTEDEPALTRAQLLGYDLERSHRVVVVQGGSDDDFFHRVRRAARDVGVGTLVAPYRGAVVVLADTDRPWEQLRAAVLAEPGGGRCGIGVGGTCDAPADFPRSYHQAELALRIQAASGAGDRATAFDQLGVYRLLAEVEDTASVERFVRGWIGAVLDYDTRKGSDLVLTLSQYLSCGGNYDATAAALHVHRSTCKYRVQRIKEISGHDLADPEVHFNLELATRAWHTLLALRGESIETKERLASARRRPRPR